MNAPQAHARVAAAVRTGRLVRQPCEECGATKVEAHHDDYDKPLDVRWLCKKHHVSLHYPPRDRENPILVRLDITRDELQSLKVIALIENKTSQALLAELVRDRIARATT